VVTLTNQRGKGDRKNKRRGYKQRPRRTSESEPMPVPSQVLRALAGKYFGTWGWKHRCPLQQGETVYMIQIVSVLFSVEKE
jgi:hypothetical protein